jgi:hypothetical protein
MMIHESGSSNVSFVNKKILWNVSTFFIGPTYHEIHTTLWSQIEGHTRLLIFREFYTLPAVI